MPAIKISQRQRLMPTVKVSQRQRLIPAAEKGFLITGWGGFTKGGHQIYGREKNFEEGTGENGAHYCDPQSGISYGLPLFSQL